MSLVVTQNDRVRILTSNDEPDPNEYQVQDIQRNVVFLTCVDTGKPTKVHRSRIREVINTEQAEGEVMTDQVTDKLDKELDKTLEAIKTPSEPQDGIDLIADSDTPPVAASKPPKQPKAPKPPKPPKAPKAPKVAAPETPVLNFNAPPFAGLEVWSKAGCDFDIETVKVAAHCVFNSTGFSVFNTYNNRLGRKTPMPTDGTLPGVHYAFTEKLTLEKKRELLGKKGYTSNQAPAVSAPVAAAPVSAPTPQELPAGQ